MIGWPSRSLTGISTVHLTSKRIMSVSGMITRTVGMMPLLRVTDMKCEQSHSAEFSTTATSCSSRLDKTKRCARSSTFNFNELYLRIVEEMYEPEAVEAKLSARMAADDGS
jgi:hypothetical protein